MNRKLATVLVLAALSGLSACGQLGLENPFYIDNTASVRDVYYSQFPDLPIPRDMSVKNAGTMVTPSSDGGKVGLETFEGRVEAASLTQAMIHNLNNAGWSLRGTVSGNKSMQVYEKDQRVAVIYITSGPIMTTMEVWMLSRQSGSPATYSSGSFNSSGNGSYPGGTLIQQWEGDYSSQPLWQ